MKDCDKFDINIYLQNEEGDQLTYNGKVEFYKNPNQYGNGCGMGIYCKTEPFGRQTYDLRYEKDFDRNNKLLYIVQHFSSRFTGKNDGYKLIGIQVKESA